jgi:hypothetical protein
VRKDAREDGSVCRVHEEDEEECREGDRPRRCEECKADAVALGNVEVVVVFVELRR